MIIITKNSLKHLASFWRSRLIDKVSTSFNKCKYTLLITLFITVFSACTQTPEKDSVTTAEVHTVESISFSTEESEKYNKGLDALNNNENTKAEQIFNEFLENRPELAGPYTNLALIQFKRKEYDQSFDLVNNALLRNPEQAQAYQLRGQIFLTKGKIPDAEKDYKKAIKLKPDYINAHYNLALLYDIYLQEIALAIKHYETYLSLLEKTDEATQEWVNHLKGALANG